MFKLTIRKTPKYKTFYKELYFTKCDLNWQFYDDCKTYFSRNHAYYVPAQKMLATGFYSMGLEKYNFADRGYNVHRRSKYNPSKMLSLNFTRNKFFPVLRTVKGDTYFFLSLGLLSKFLLKGKAFTKSKTVFLLLASFLRKILLFSSFSHMYLLINKTPVYFKEIMSNINEPVVNVYKSPFSKEIISEKEVVNPFSFPIIMFLNNKAYGTMKTKKKGRLKRKIARRLITINRVLD